MSWPGAIHEGNGTRQTIVDESLTGEQREAMESLDSGTVGGAYFEVFAAVCPNRLDTVVAPIHVVVDRQARRGSIQIPNIVESQVKPITNPVTGEEHRARIDLPGGFEYTQAEMANTVFAKVTKAAGVGIGLNLENTYAQLNAFDWSNA